MCTRMIPALVPRGARQRGRTADGRAWARHVEGTQRVLKRGYSTRVLKRGTRSSGEGASGACGRIRRIMGGQCSAVLCTLGVWQYVSGTHGVLKAYSRGTPGVPTLRGALPGGGGAQRCARVQRQEGYSRGTPRVLIGCSRVLTGYAHGTAHPATHAAPLSGGCGSLCRTQWAVRGTRA
jgi:hypothetical protein